jgi:hypothetical protein
MLWLGSAHPPFSAWLPFRTGKNHLVHTGHCACRHAVQGPCLATWHHPRVDQRAFYHCILPLDVLQGRGLQIELHLYELGGRVGAWVHAASCDTM